MTGHTGQETPQAAPVPGAGAWPGGAQPPSEHWINRRWRRFFQHRLAVTSAICLVLILAAALGAPLITRQNPTAINLKSSRQAPSATYLLGTDALGRDLLTRLLYGGRVSLLIGFVAVAISTIMGTLLGAIAGFFGGWVDAVIMRISEVFLSFPPLVMIIALVSITRPGLQTIMVVIGILSWPGTCRLMRGQLLVAREAEYTLAARVAGIPNARLIWRHILPNLLAPLIVAATFGMASAILIEAGLSFLGLGVQPPIPSWGNLLIEARTLDTLEQRPWLWAPPGTMIALTVLCINFIGDGLRDAFDPRSTR